MSSGRRDTTKSVALSATMGRHLDAVAKGHCEHGYFSTARGIRAEELAPLVRLGLVESIGRRPAFDLDGSLRPKLESEAFVVTAAGIAAGVERDNHYAKRLARRAQLQKAG